MPQEIERKFLPAPGYSIPTDCPMQSIVQFYSVIDPDQQLEVRYQRCQSGSAGQYQRLTKPGSGLLREESLPEIISADEFSSAMCQCLGQVIEKTIFRQPDPVNSVLTIEHHVYHKQLEELVLLEVEFPSLEASQQWQPPDWFGLEVSTDRRYRNQSLALNGLPLDFDLRRLVPDQIGQRMSIPEAVAALTSVLQRRLPFMDRPMIVGVVGGSAAGKTSQVSVAIQRELPGIVKVMSQDNYYRGRQWLEAESQQRQVSWDEPSAIDLDLMAQHIAALRQGRSVQMPHYDHNVSAVTKFDDFPPTQIIVVEGLYPFYEPVLSLLDLRVFVHVDVHGQLIRRSLRDITERGWRPEDIIKYMTETVIPMHYKYVANTVTAADLVIANEYRPETESVRYGLANPQIKFPGWPKSGVLIQLGAHYLITAEQDDVYFSAPDRDLRLTDELLRIRQEVNRLSLTYKGPKVGTDGERRMVFHVSIEPQTASQLRQIYRPLSTTIWKERRLYLYEDIIISLDLVKVTFPDGSQRAGQVTEFQYRPHVDEQSQWTLTSLVEKLGLQVELGKAQSYLELALENPSFFNLTPR